jgi:hypothetical protein
MPQIIKNETFADGQLVTGLRLNNIIDLATLGSQAITAQTAVSAFDIESMDYLLVYDASATALRKATIDDIFRSGQTIKVSSISGVSGANLAVSIAGGYYFSVNGNTNITGDLVGTGLIQGATGKFGTELTIPSGTTATRPASPLAGSTRFNTDTGMLEVYSGAAWVNSSILGSNNTFSGTNTFSNTVNITGAIQYNGTAVYSLSAISEETITTATGSGVLWTSSAFTKPSDEIWVFEAEGVLATVGGAAWTGTLSFLNTSGTAYCEKYGTPSSMSYAGTAYLGYHFYNKWVVQAGVSLSIETVRIQLGIISGGSVVLNPSSLPAINSKFRIYKYRTA